MAYYMSSGVKVSEGAAGLGAMPPQAAAGLASYFGRDDPQAAANGVGQGFDATRGIGFPLFLNGQRVREPMTLYHGPGMEGLGQNGCPPGLAPVFDVLQGKTVCAPSGPPSRSGPCPSGCEPIEAPPGGAAPGAADPAVHAGGYTGTATTRFGCMMEFQRTNDYAQYEACNQAISTRNRVATEGSQPVPFGTSMRAFREGILGGRGLAPDQFGVRERPFRDGIFGGGLGQDNGEPPPPEEPPADDKILGMSPMTLTAVTVGGVVILVGVLALRKK